MYTMDKSFFLRMLIGIQIRIKASTKRKNNFIEYILICN
ncbi:hypothetical protein C943_01351 [Mariniradius saccharolyticus AK6]|uniref:Uncharacterized protein n=1 Tax=Mariniradius saccharolyticus AK6 TaxID=1239962 RepID=M7XB13_9BACT|nr:hypothetical protein C943_01351 [Mariniradius saccharolyticus AK6]